MSTGTKCIDCGAPVTRELISWCDACWQGRNTPIEQPAPVSATEPEFPATFLFAPSSSEPKMLPAVAWLREEADTWSAFKGDEPDEPNTARTLNGIADYITTIRARLVEAERVTEDSAIIDALAAREIEVECMGTTVPYWNVVVVKTGEMFTASPSLVQPTTLREALTDALTAARGGG